MLCILCVSFNVAKLHRGYQAMIMKYKDKRMAITIEVLNNMKIIKLQVCYYILTSFEVLFREQIVGIFAAHLLE